MAADLLYPDATLVLPRQVNPNVESFMSTHVRTIYPGASPLPVAQAMIEYDIGRLPVVEDGRIIGIVTGSDTMRYFYDLLPE